MSGERLSVYDRLREQISPEDVLRRLGIETAERSGNEVYLAPLCHQSTSGKSLHLNLDTGRWLCFACVSSGVAGDLFQFVEYWLSGGRAPSRGPGASSNASREAALRWLCEQYVVPFDEGRPWVSAEFDVLDQFAGLAHDYLASEEGATLRSWIAEKWAFSDDVVRDFRIGFMPSPLFPELVDALAGSSSLRAAMVSAGLGYVSREIGVFETRFEGRVLFPYLEHGRCVYLIGRATPWTPKRDGRDPSKYHKLPVHSEKNPAISKRIRNDYLFNGSSIGASGVKRALMPEGVTDGIAFASIGVAGVASPVGLSARVEVVDAYVEKLKLAGIDHVDLVFDEELSGAGSQGARLMAERTIEGGISVSVIRLTLGPAQEAARAEVFALLGAERFAELESCSSLSDRIRLIAESSGGEVSRTEWLQRSVAASKIDGAEWVAWKGAAALDEIEALRRASSDYIVALIESVEVPEGEDPERRLELFEHPLPGSKLSIVELAARVDSEIRRSVYASAIAKRAGRPVTKDVVARRIARVRTEVRGEKKKTRAQEVAERQPIERIVVPPPIVGVAPQLAPPPPPPGPEKTLDDSKARKIALPVPPSPTAAPSVSVDEFDHFRHTREQVQRAVEKRGREDEVGQAIAQSIATTMGFVAFRTQEGMFLLRGNQRVEASLQSSAFLSIVYVASGLLKSKATHRGYIEAILFHVGRGAKSVRDVSWSHVAADRTVYFPTGSPRGDLLHVERGKVSRTRMSEAKVPAVSGRDFRQFEYVEDAGGVAAALSVFRWTSLSEGDRLVLIYWIVALPLLRLIGVVPIVRIEGGSNSGKTRTVDGISWLVNGGESSSVPTAAALISRLSVEMITIDDNRETADVSDTFLGTILQATGLGAREKRRQHSDTETVVERVCGAFLMNGIEPIHNGRSEVASRFLTLRCHPSARAVDSPSANSSFCAAVAKIRSSFWSEAVRLCAAALELDATYGERFGAEIEAVFGATKIGRLSSYLRVMYLCWVAGQQGEERARHLESMAPVWREAFAALGRHALDSLVREDLVVSALRCALAYGRSQAKLTIGGGHFEALDGKYVLDESGTEFLGPVTSARLARIVRQAAKDTNAPVALTRDLRAGQLEARLLDGVAVIQAAGILVDVDVVGPRVLWSFCRPPRDDRVGRNGAAGGVARTDLAATSAADSPVPAPAAATASADLWSPPDP